MARERYRELELGQEGGGERELGKGKGQASSTVPASEVQRASKSGSSGDVQSQAGIAPHRTGIGRQTYASAARKTSGGANQTTAGDGRRGMWAEREGGVGENSRTVVLVGLS
jgi:hypothetical protein